MNNWKFILFFLTMLCGSVSAQTDMTNRITNPSFESGTDGWVQKSLATQNNNIFSIKAGNTYLEKWTSRGGAVGSASVSQTLNNLPPGNYELSAAAQNIQEDSPSAAQTGAWIFAGGKQTTVTVRATYKVAFTHVSGSVAIGFEAVNASGNWIACDNFRLTQVGTDLSNELNAAIASTEAAYGQADGSGSQQLKDAITAARVVAVDASASGEQQAQAIISLEKAVETYRLASASEANPLDMTDRIVNPSFETGDFTGWTQTGMATQGNSVFSIKQGNTYVERWTGRGGAVGNGTVSQTLTGMPAGRYRMKVAAQNIQEDAPNAAKSGACIFANSSEKPVTVRGEYTLEFTLVSDELTIGFRAEDAQGNWIACDNFRMEYISNSLGEIEDALNALITNAETLAGQRMNTATLHTLQAAIDAAREAAKSGTDVEVWAGAARQLEAAYAEASTSAEVFAHLADAIQKATDELNSSGGHKETYAAGIAQAQAVYDAEATTNAMAEAAIAALDEAAFAFRIENGSGAAPRVTTDTRFIRGATWAFGRSSVSGQNIMEEGFCWSTEPDPKVTDNRTTEYLNQAGKIYWLRDLKPATVYYMRAYAITKTYAVGYGDVIKVVTVPKGTIGHWYNNGGDEATNDRINYAINNAIDYYWNNLTAIHDFGISVTYSPGTPTADCGYGGGMRVGANASYQSTGTIMHETLHGIGVGTHGIWWNGEMRSGGDRGDWLGDRVTEAVRFWDNSTTAVITGDNTHLWPYGCNGAQEDSHSDNLYCMMGILAQALNEDGLPASGSIGYALPYYSFNHEDGVKYYIKNEDSKRGLYDSYLVETASHQLEWKSMTAEEAAANDAAGWYLSFTPANQYYQLKNAGSGYYMTYSGGIRTARHTTPTTADNFHLMRGRVDVSAGKGTANHRGYYIIHPESNATPPTLGANTGGKTAAEAWNLAKDATTQRWLILTADEAAAFEAGTVGISKKELEEMLASVRKMAQTPHREDVNGADSRLSSTLDAIESDGKAATTSTAVTALIADALQAGIDFLYEVTASDSEQPFDLTFMLQNPDFDTDATTGWTTSQTPGYSYQTAEFFQQTFNFSQTLKGMPAGTYMLAANAFQRPGAYDAVLQPFLSGTAKVTSSLFIGRTSAPVKHICEDRQADSQHSASKWLSDDTYIPDNMASGAAYFAAGLYESSVTAEQAKPGNISLGIKCTSSATAYWTMFDHFRLYYFGGNAVYDLSGRRVNAKQLQPGIYVVNGKKVFRTF